MKSHPPTDPANRDHPHAGQTATRAGTDRDIFQKLMDDADQAIFVAQDGKLVYLNPVVSRLIGYSPAELATTPFLAFIYPDDQAMIMDRHLRRLRGEDLPQGYPFRIVDRAGVIHWVELNAAVTEWEGRPATLNFLRDISEQKQAEEALRASREELRLTLDATTDGIWQWNFKTSEMSFSSRYYTMLGYEPGAFPATFKAWQELIHPDDRARAFSLAKTYFGSSTDDYENVYRLRNASGVYRWIHSRGRVVERDGEGNAVRIIGRHDDITRLKEAEAELARNEARLRSLVRILQSPFDRVQEFLDYALNEAIDLTQSRLGYIYFYDEARGEFILNTWSRDVMKECAVAEPQTLYQLEKTGLWGEAVRQRRPIVVNDFQAPNPLRKGYPKGHVELNRFLTVPVFSGDRIVAVVGVGNKERPYNETDTLQLTLLMDVVWKETARKDAQNALQEREKTYRSLFDSIRDPLLVADENRTIVDCNPAFSELFEYNPEEIRGQKTAVIYAHQEDHEAIGRDLMDSLGDREIAASIVFKKKSGDVFTGDVKLSYLKDRDDKITGVVGQIRDQSERLRAEADRSELEAQFRQAQKLEAVGRLTGGVAHDFNNLLAVISGYTDLMLMDLEENTPMRKRAIQIRDAGRKAADLIRQLMAFSRRQILQPEVLNPNAILLNLKKMLPRIIGEDIALVFHLGADVGNIRGDAGQMEQVIMNLAVNARDAMPEGGKLTVETVNVDLSGHYARRHAGVAAGPYVMVAVSDTGIGMDKPTVEQIFDPFFTTKEKGKGTGLGLSTVYGIVKQHGGHIWVYSEPGQGTAFKVYLPRVADETRERRAPGEDASPRGGAETILLVEDHDDVRELVEAMLQSLGYTVLPAPTGQEALAICVQKHGLIDLLLTDLVMPGMNGRDLAQRIEEIRPGIKVLFMSGYTDNGIVRHGVLNRGVHFIQKPFTLPAVAEKVRSVLAGQEGVQRP